MGYSETAKHFNDIRSMARQLYVNGYKTRNEIVASSSKKNHAAENDIKRVESLFKEFSKIRTTASKEKISYVSIDSRENPENPLYKLFRSAKFGDTGLTVYFGIIEILSCGEKLILSEISRKIDELGITEEELHDDTIRNWLNALSSIGILTREKEKNHDVYSIPKQLDIGNLYLPICFFSEFYPLGVLGYFTKGDIFPKKEQNIFSYKHHYILSALDSEIVFSLLVSIKNKQEIFLWQSRGTVTTREIKESCSKWKLIPVKLYLGTQGGRNYLCAFDEEADEFKFFRIDRIFSVENIGLAHDFEKYRIDFQSIESAVWNVQLGDLRNKVHVSMTIEIQENKTYLFERLKSEGRNGKITKTDNTHYVYENDLFDAEEMIPWIRSFFGCITDFKCSDNTITKKLREDLLQWIAMECAGND